MSTEVRDGELVVFFHHGESNRWTMPHRNDKDGIRKVRAEAVEFVMKNDATDGQKNAVLKAITEAGYHLTK